MDRLILDLSHIDRGTSLPVGGIASPVRETPSVSFEDVLMDSMKEVNSLQLEADEKIRRLAIGDVDDLSEVVLASSRADMSLRLLMELRNKFLDAYQALSRITG